MRAKIVQVRTGHSSFLLNWDRPSEHTCIQSVKAAVAHALHFSTIHRRTGIMPMRILGLYLDFNDFGLRYHLAFTRRLGVSWPPVNTDVVQPWSTDNLSMTLS